MPNNSPPLKGWLGALIGSKLYFDFSSDEESQWQLKLKDLIKELGSRGKVAPVLPRLHEANVVRFGVSSFVYRACTSAMWYVLVCRRVCLPRPHEANVVRFDVPTISLRVRLVGVSLQRVQ